MIVYPALGSSTGLLNEAPSATISTTKTTGLSYPQGIALDSSGKIYVADEVTSLAMTPRACMSIRAGSNGNAAPIATISGGNTGLCYPVGIALDSSGNIYVADEDATSVFVYPPLGSSTGTLNEAPTATINGSNTGLINHSASRWIPAATSM